MVAIGNGNVRMANAFVEEVKFEGEIYTDPELHSYKALNFKVISTEYRSRTDLDQRKKLITVLMKYNRNQMALAPCSLLACGRRPTPLLRRVSVKVRFFAGLYLRSVLLTANLTAKTQGDSSQLGGVLIVEPEDHVSQIHGNRPLRRNLTFPSPYYQNTSLH